jgi:hypothetical protein
VQQNWYHMLSANHSFLHHELMQRIINITIVRSYHRMVCPVPIGFDP